MESIGIFEGLRTGNNEMYYITTHVYMESSNFRFPNFQDSVLLERLDQKLTLQLVFQSAAFLHCILLNSFPIFEMKQCCPCIWLSAEKVGELGNARISYEVKYFDHESYVVLLLRLLEAEQCAVIVEPVSVRVRVTERNYQNVE